MSKDINQNVKPVYEFGPFKADAASQTLLRDGRPIALPSKAFDVLVALLERHGTAIEKGELIRKVWPDSFVEEINLLVQISTLRKAMGDSAMNPTYIATISKHGYKFIGDVTLAHLPEEVEGAEEALERIDEQVQPIIDATVNKDVRAQVSAPSPVKKNRWVSTRAVILFLLIVSALSASSYLWQKRRREVKTQGLPEYAAGPIAILPFKLMGMDADGKLGAEIAEALKSRLNKMEALTSWPPDSIKVAEGWSKNPLESGRELGASLVLNGAVRRAGDNIQVTAQLMRVEDGTPLWADEFSYRSADLFAARELISNKLLDELTPALTGRQRGPLIEESKNMKAYELLLRGRFLQQKRTRESLEESAKFFQEAIREDPDYAYAYGELAYCYYALRAARFLSTEEAIPRVISSAVKAVELNDKLGWIHALLGFSRARFEWNWEEAEESFKRAINSSPNLFTHIWYSQYLMLTGRADESRAEIGRALQHSPNALDANIALANYFYWSGQYDEAINHLVKTADRYPNAFTLHQALAAAYREKGLYDNAVAESERAAKIAKEKALWEDPLPDLAYTYAVAGRRREALKLLARIKNKKAGSPYGLAQVFSGLGKYDKAIELLNVAFDKRDPDLPWIKLDPTFKNLRPDPRFAILLRRMRL
jgi:DNA-binding winged helix-turn-helix (wHTH) protein/TolB-like protein